MRLHPPNIIFETEGLNSFVMTHLLGHSGINFIGERFGSSFFEPSEAAVVSNGSRLEWYL
jgi:hypothetical protein